MNGDDKKKVFLFSIYMQREKKNTGTRHKTRKKEKEERCSQYLGVNFRD